MISDRSLIRISLATSVIGIVALYLLTLIGPSHTAIPNIKAGDNVAVSGVVKDYRESRGNIFFTMENASSVKVVMFAPDAEKAPMIKNGDTVTVSGKAQYYRNEIEIIAKSIVK
mgnify:CR=1 FL=1